MERLLQMVLVIRLMMDNLSDKHKVKRPVMIQLDLLEEDLKEIFQAHDDHEDSLHQIIEELQDKITDSEHFECLLEQANREKIQLYRDAEVAKATSRQALIDLGKRDGSFKTIAFATRTLLKRNSNFGNFIHHDTLAGMVEDAYHAGEGKVETIKHIRLLTDMGLKEAKEYVERFRWMNWNLAPGDRS